MTLKFKTPEPEQPKPLPEIVIGQGWKYGDHIWPTKENAVREKLVALLASKIDKGEFRYGGPSMYVCATAIAANPQEFAKLLAFLIQDL